MTISSVLAIGSWRAALVASFVFRVGVALNSLFNEWGHILVALTRGCGRRALNTRNIWGGRALGLHVLACLPFVPDLRGDLTVRIPGLCEAESGIVRVRGFLVGTVASVLLLLLTGALALGAPPWVSGAWLALLLGTTIAVAAAFVTDMTRLTSYAGRVGVMACGNVTILGRLGQGERAAFPSRGRELFTNMVKISQMRGAQSGGGAIQIARRGQARHLIRKTLNTKRGDLAQRLGAVLSASAGGFSAFGDSFLVQGHVRYATASVSSEHEAHPFCFMDPTRRGARRILRWVGGRASIVDRPVETTLTHNGDMDGLRFRGTLLGYPDLGQFLERVLGVPNRWSGDSPQLAGVVELFLTQGMWLESLRLAYQMAVAPQPPDPKAVPVELVGRERTRELRRLFASHAAPDLACLRGWAQIAEQAWLGEGGTQHASGSEGGSFREQLAARLAAQFERSALPELALANVQAFSRDAVDAFLDNDLFVAMRKLTELLEGTFGCVVTSTLEPGCMVAFSRGQPLSLGFSRDGSTAAVVSERIALKVRAGDGRPAFAERLDLDLCHGEIARVEIEPRGRARLTVFSVAEGREYGRSELEAARRMVPLEDNPYVTALPTEASDRVGADIEDVAPILARIRSDWQTPSSLNVRTAEAFARALLGSRRPRLLVIGITNDLWLSQQFVHNLGLLFPNLQAEAKSSNAVLKDLERLPPTEGTVVLAVSQSGQDFPTLAALLSLQERAGLRGSQSFFALSGEADTLIGEAVGQSYARGAEFCNRLFVSGAGFRPSEAALATVNATQHTFVELLLFLARCAQNAEQFPNPPHGYCFTAAELDALTARRDVTVDLHAPQITAEVASGRAPELSRELRREARRWSWHVLESVVAVLAVVLVLQLNLQFRVGLLPSHLLRLLPRPEHPSALSPWRLLELVSSQSDVVFYALLAPCAVWILRCCQRRPAFHRHGVRELLIGDTGYVHRIVWLLAKKLFSLSYGFASLKPYSADNQDELVLTHEPLRGTLALFGLPDQGRAHLRARAAAARMTAHQFNNSRSAAGAGAEILTIGHSPKASSHRFSGHIALPHTSLSISGPVFDALLEDMFDSWERLLGMQVFLNHLAAGIAKLGPLGYDRSRTKDQVFAATTAAPVSAAALYQLLADTRARFGHFERDLPFVTGAGPGPHSPRVRTLTWPSPQPERPSSNAA